MLRLIFSAALLAAGPASAQVPAPSEAAQPPAPPAADPAILFGVRESIEQIDISPDGQRVVYLQPGPGRTTIVYLHDLTAGGFPSEVMRSSGSPERFRWCRFATNDRIVCAAGGMSELNGTLIPFSRLFSMNRRGQDLKMLGQRASYYDARLRQFDGAILDWGSGADSSVLMAREVVPEAGRFGSCFGRSGRGVA